MPVHCSHIAKDSESLIPDSVLNCKLVGHLLEFRSLLLAIFYAELLIILLFQVAAS